MFNKEKLIFETAQLNDAQTIQYIAQHSFLISLISIWLITILTFIIVSSMTKKKNFGIAFIISMGINIMLTIMVVLGILPLWLSI